MKLTLEQREDIINNEAEGMTPVGSGYFGTTYILKYNPREVIKITREDGVEDVNKCMKSLDRAIDLHGVQSPRIHDCFELKSDADGTRRTAVIQDYIQGNTLMRYDGQDVIQPLSDSELVDALDDECFKIVFGDDFQFTKHRDLAKLDERHYKKLFEDMYSLIREGVGLDLNKESNFILNDSGFWLVDTHASRDGRQFYITNDICKAISQAYVLLVRVIDDDGDGDSLRRCKVFTQPEIDKFHLQSAVSDKFLTGLKMAGIPEGFKKLGLDEIEQCKLYESLVADKKLHTSLVEQGIVDQDDRLSVAYAASHPNDVTQDDA